MSHLPAILAIALLLLVVLTPPKRKRIDVVPAKRRTATSDRAAFPLGDGLTAVAVPQFADGAEGAAA